MNVLWDTACSGVIVRKSLMDKTDMTGKMGHMMMVDD